MHSETTKHSRTATVIAAAALGTAVFLGGLAAGYRRFGRTTCLTWGASGEEIARIMPGDDLLPAPDILVTRSITIFARSDQIWPWLVQMGPNGPRLRVVALDPGHTLVFAAEDGRRVWAFGLYPTTGGTRLVSRNRIAVPHAAWPRRLFDLLIMEPGSLLTERKMLLGIKERAERGPCVRTASARRAGNSYRVSSSS
jgi:hypothetical protein